MLFIVRSCVYWWIDYARSLGEVEPRVLQGCKQWTSRIRGGGKHLHTCLNESPVTLKNAAAHFRCYCVSANIILLKGWEQCRIRQERRVWECCSMCKEKVYLLNQSRALRRGMCGDREEGYALVVVVACSCCKQPVLTCADAGLVRTYCNLCALCKECAYGDHARCNWWGPFLPGSI